MTNKFLWAATTGLLLMTGPIAATAQDSKETQSNEMSTDQKYEKSLDEPKSAADETVVPEEEKNESGPIERAIDDPNEKPGDENIIPNPKKHESVDESKKNPADETIVPKEEKDESGPIEKAIDDPSEKPGDENLIPNP